MALPLLYCSPCCSCNCPPGGSSDVGRRNPSICRVMPLGCCSCCPAYIMRYSICHPRCVGRMPCSSSFAGIDRCAEEDFLDRTLVVVTQLAIKRASYRNDVARSVPRAITLTILLHGVVGGIACSCTVSCVDSQLSSEI